MRTLMRGHAAAYQMNRLSAKRGRTKYRYAAWI